MWFICWLTLSIGQIIYHLITQLVLILCIRWTVIYLMDSTKPLNNWRQGQSWLHNVSCSASQFFLRLVKILRSEETCNSRNLQVGNSKWYNLVPRAFSLRKWEGREKALASAGHMTQKTPRNCGWKNKNDCLWIPSKAYKKDFWEKS